MYAFTVQDMTCQHCEKAIRNEIEDLDAQAKVQVDLESKTVRVESQHDQEAVRAAIAEAGFDVQNLS